MKISISGPDGVCWKIAITFRPLSHGAKLTPLFSSPGRLSDHFPKAAERESAVP